MLKKSLISLAVAASVAGISGCDISSTTSNAGNVPEVQQQNQAAIANKTFPLFNPARSVLPVGIDLIFADASDSDGTANVGADVDNPVKKALNDLDGISTLAPIDVQFSNPLDVDSVVGGENVFLIQLPNASDVGGDTNLILPDGLTAADVDALDITSIAPFFATTKPDGTAADDSAFAAGEGLPESVAALNLFGANDGIPLGAPDPAPTQTDGIIATQPQAGVDYEVTVVGLDGAENNTIRINPLKPLRAKTKYIVLVTNGVEDDEGNPVDPSADYETISGDGPLVSDALAPVRSLVQNLEALGGNIITKGGTDPSPLANDIVYTAPFTTTDPTAVLGAMTAPAAALPTALNPSNATSDLIEPQFHGFEFIPAGQISAKTLTTVPESGAVLAPFDVSISQGAIVLPQYTESFAVNGADKWEALDTAATPVDTDGTTNVTYRFPFAEKKRDAVVPVMMFEPDGTGTSSACTGGKPWPVVIMVHGFQSSRAGTILTGAEVANNTCHAVVAIDLPHHGVAADAGTQLVFNVENPNEDTPSATPWATAVAGVVDANAATPENTILDELAERHQGFFLDANTGSPMPMDYDNASGDSGSLFIRLDNFQRTRDNMRQGVMDLLNLNASLGSIDLDGTANGPDLDVTDVKFIGHSLGAIIGTPFVALNNASLAGNANLNQIKSAVLATPGGHMTKLIENSALLSGKFLPALAASSDGVLVQGSSSLESFMKVFQATLDSADPMNFTGALKAVSTPTLIVGMYGNAASDPEPADLIPADLVVPVTGEGTVLANGEAKAPSAVNPLTGLNPFLELLGAENVTGTPAGTIYIAKYNEGGHGTFSSAGLSTDANAFDSADAHNEMVLQTVDLFDDNAVDANKAATVLIPEAP